LKERDEMLRQLPETARKPNFGLIHRLVSEDLSWLVVDRKTMRWYRRVRAEVLWVQFRKAYRRGRTIELDRLANGVTTLDGAASFYVEWRWEWLRMAACGMLRLYGFGRLGRPALEASARFASFLSPPAQAGASS